MIVVCFVCVLILEFNIVFVLVKFDVILLVFSMYCVVCMGVVEWMLILLDGVLNVCVNLMFKCVNIEIVVVFDWLIVVLFEVGFFVYEIGLVLVEFVVGGVFDFVM